ncbi:hypothetical protein T492DRAFT_150326 [Pavlovales sp. CCMP2436]|nr:hypothetical protein T492DRAFT_150326 [Pavlovales sp. CCMP2436]
MIAMLVLLAAPALGGPDAVAVRAEYISPATLRKRNCAHTCARCHGLDRQLAVLPGRGSPATQRNRTAEIVVSHCRHDLRWLANARAAVEAAGLVLARVTVVTKCGRLGEVAKLPELRGARIITAKNWGRCDHVWALHLANEYARLADVVLFVKDSTFDYPLSEMRAVLLTVPEVLNATATAGLGCFRKPHSVGSAWHLRRELFKFRMASYVSADEQAKVRHAESELKAASQARTSRLLAQHNNDPGRSSSTRAAAVEKSNSTTSMAAFPAPVSMCEFAARALGDGPALRRLLSQTYVNVCYGGSFAVTADRVRQHSREVYGRLETMLQRGDSVCALLSLLRRSATCSAGGRTLALGSPMHAPTTVCAPLSDGVRRSRKGTTRRDSGQHSSRRQWTASSYVAFREAPGATL